jgi:hypothetical protein
MEIKDGNDIVPEADISEFKHLAHFADWFRYNLLLKRGGWWVDMDTVCLQPFDGWGHPFVSWRGADHVISEQHDRAGGFAVNNAYLRASPGSPVMAWIVRQAMKVDRKSMGWEATANTLCLQAVAKFRLPVQPLVFFNPIPWWEWASVIDYPLSPPMPETTYAVHLWHAMWRQAGRDTNAKYQPECLYEQLKRRYAAAMGGS